MSASYAASAIAWEITAPRARAPRRDTARSDASRSACADASSAWARAAIDVSRSSDVRIAKRASTSVVRAVDTSLRRVSARV